MADSYLINYLAEQDIPCPGCGYNLRGLKAEHCPECGESIVLNVGLAEPKLGAYIAGIIGLTLGLGFHGFMLLWLLYLAVSENFSMWEDTPLMFIGLVGTGIGLMFWLRKRSFVRRSRRLGLVVLCWAFSLVTVWGFLLMSR